MTLQLLSWQICIKTGKISPTKAVVSPRATQVTVGLSLTCRQIELLILTAVCL